MILSNDVRFSFNPYRNFQKTPSKLLHSCDIITVNTLVCGGSAMSQLDHDIRAADAMGISYGYYIARSYNPDAAMADPSPTSQKRRRTRRYTDEQLFLLWQEGKTDEQIGQAVGVSRQFIQRWRDQLELPSTSKFRVNTQKYRLTTLRDGTYIVIISD